MHAYFFWSILIMWIFCSGCGVDSKRNTGLTYEYPLKVSENKRYLTDQNNKPFFWAGDAAWSLIAQLDRADVEYYLNDRAKKGYTVLLVNLIEHKFADHAPANFYQDKPFTGRPFVAPNDQYFQYADEVIRAARKRGMAVLLCPLYLGWEYGDEGWGQEVKNASAEDLIEWGQYVGERYTAFDNIIWCIGGDADPSLEREKINLFVNALSHSDKNHLFTAHNVPKQFAISPWKDENWLNINNIYSYSTTLYELCRTAYQSSPVIPYFMIESAYENEHNASAQRLRSEIYWPLLSGGMGFVAGNCPIWNFSADSTFCEWSDWKIQLDRIGSENVAILQKLFRSRPWHLLKPDFNNEILVNEDQSWGSEDYATAAYASDSSFLIAYLPVPKPVHADLTKIAGTQVRCWWYDPIKGKSTEIGTFWKCKDMRLMPPTAQDWVLVIENKENNFPAPGEVLIY